MKFRLSFLATIFALVFAFSGHAYAWDAQTLAACSPIAQDGGSAYATCLRQVQAQRQAQKQAQNQSQVFNPTITIDNATGLPSAATGNGATGNGWNGRLPASSAYAPTVAPAVDCGGKSYSGGGQSSLLGVSLGFGDMDKFCQAERFGNLQTAGQKIDFAWQCLDRGEEFRKAAANAGFPCPGTAQPVVQQAAAPAPSSHSYWPDYCYTAEPGYAKQHRECNGAPHLKSH